MYLSARTAADLSGEGVHLPFLSPDPQNGVCYCRYWNRLSHRCLWCWRRWAYKRFHQIKARLERLELADDSVWHHIVLHYRSMPDTGRRAKMLSYLLGSLKRKYKGTRYIWVWHKKAGAIHCHVLANAAVEIDSDWLAGRWERIMDKYGTKRYSPRDCYCQPRDYPNSVLAYILGISKTRKKEGRPWDDLTGKVTDNNLPRGKRLRPDADTGRVGLTETT